MSWNAPEIEVTVDGKTRLGTVRVLEVVAGRNQPVATAYLDLSNVRFEWQDGAKDGDILTLKWGWRGKELLPLFTGTVLRAHLRETLQIWGLCRGRALVDSRVTRTYKDESATAVVNHLVEPCGYETKFCTAVDTEIDKLPLQNNTVVEAINFLNRRLGLDHPFYCDAVGAFHWEKEDRSQKPAFSFTHGQDVAEWKAIPGNRFLLTVMGTPVWHSQVVGITDRAGKGTNYFVEQVRHTLGINGEGARSKLWLSEVVDG